MTDPADGTRVVRGACPHDCPDTCAMLVTVQDGVVTGVRGDPDHPYTAGALCPKVNDYEVRVHSPDRLLHPLRRVGRKGEGRFEQVTWEAALDEIAERLGAIRDEHGGEAILPYSYLGAQGVAHGLGVGDPFFHRLGASVLERTYCGSAVESGYVMVNGPAVGFDPESLAHARFIIVWACNMQSTNLHAWKFVAQAQKRGAKLVVIDPLRTKTARKADWHIPIRPGTDAALALGMAHVIVDEGLIDADYVERHTLGYERLRERVAEYPPERVAAITGMPAEDVVTLSREYAATQPAAIRVGVAIERHVSGGEAMRALACLPALTGAWRHPGGGLLESTAHAVPMNLDAIQRPDLIAPGTRVVNQWRLGPALTGELGLDPPIRALFVYNSNPAITSADQGRILDGLAREDLFCVVAEQFMTDTARYADLVLPCTTQAEQLDIVPSWGQLYLTMNVPAIAPLGEALPNREIFRRLSRRMGFERELYGDDDEQFLREVAFLWDDPHLDGITYDSLLEAGWARMSFPPPDRFAPHAEGNFATPSGKCELWSSLAEQLGDWVLPEFREGYTELQGGAPVDPLPRYVESSERDERHPLTLLSPKAHGFVNSCFGDADRQLRLMGDRQWLMIHPDDAAARDVADGQAVRVHNDRGELQAEARLSADVARGVVVCPLGWWHGSSPNGVTVNALTPTGFTTLGRTATISDAAVEVVALG